MKNVLVSAVLAVLTAGCTLQQVSVFRHEGEFYVIYDQLTDTDLYILRGGVWERVDRDLVTADRIREIASDGTTVGATDLNRVFKEANLPDAERRQEAASRAESRPAPVPAAQPGRGVTRNPYLDDLYRGDGGGH